MRVMHVVYGGLFGGGQIVAVDLVRALPTFGVEVDLCVLGADDPRFDAVPHAAILYRGVYRDPWVLFPVARRLRERMEETRAEIVHAHGWDAELVSAIAVGNRPVAHVSHIHGTQGWVMSPLLKHRIRRALTRWAVRRSRTAFIAVSEATKRAVCRQMGWRPDRVTVIRNGIETGRFAGIGARPAGIGRRTLVLGMAARLTDGKGVEVLVRAVRRLKDRGVRCEARMAGEGPERADYEALAVDLGIADRIAFLGFVGDMAGFYRDLDVFVLPSDREGLPLTVLEAMAAGRPVVATDVMGIPEAVTDGAEGFLVPPQDPERLAGAIGRFVEDPGLGGAMGARARSRAMAEFDRERVVKQIADYYRRFA